MSSKSSERAIKFNYRWIRDVYDIMNKIEKYQMIVDDERNPPDQREIFAKEIEIQKQDLEDLKTLVKGFKSEASQLLYKKYVEGYTLEEIAVEMGYSESFARKVHAQFTNGLRKKGLAI